MHWILPAVGYGVYGFTFGSISATALSYLMDCHQEVSILFMRNPGLTLFLPDYRRCPSRGYLHAQRPVPNCSLRAHAVGQWDGLARYPYYLRSHCVCYLSDAYPAA